MTRPLRRALVLTVLLLGLSWWLMPYAFTVPLAAAALALSFTGGFGAFITSLALLLDPEV